MNPAYLEYLDTEYKRELGYDWRKCFYRKLRIPIEFEYFIDDFMWHYTRMELSRVEEKNRKYIPRDMDIFYNRSKRKYNGQITLLSLSKKYNVSKERIRQIYFKVLRKFISFLYSEGILR